MLTTGTPIKDTGRVGKTAAPALARLGLRTAGDLLWHYPVRHDDLSQVVPIAELVPGQTATVHGRIELIASRRSWKRRRLTITEAVVADATGQVKVTWFNQPYVAKLLPPGTAVALAGRVEGTDHHFSLVSPTYERLLPDGEQTHTGRLVPIYPATEGVSQKQIRFLIHQALPLADQLADQLADRDPVPSWLRERYSLIALPDALRQLHFPVDQQSLGRARHRLAFDELLLLSLRARLARAAAAGHVAPAVPIDLPFIQRFVAHLPFTLTADQRTAAWRTLQRLAKPEPMQLLLQGDVGSGKTVVATIAAAAVARAGWQAVLLAPTEVLAEQHWQTIRKMLEHEPLSAALLTASRYERWPVGEATTKRELYRSIGSGEVSLVVGTHALLEDKLNFAKLTLVVVDEQHRFGVNQRASLRFATAGEGGGTIPHLLTMTATPIPRSLALILHGHLDVASLRTKPSGRPPTSTTVLTPDRRAELYALIRSQVAAGRQAFVVCPRVAESDELGVKAATVEYERLTAEELPGLRIGLLHGQMRSTDKAEAMARFVANDLDVLVTTTVIEVGVDVPNATVMAVEGAERFGLAQLHQLRGRVGRGAHPSYCLLLSESNRPEALERLKLVESCADGLALATADLASRGAGQLFGTQQSGFGSPLRLATLNDVKLLHQTGEAAALLLERDHDLSDHPATRRALAKLESTAHLE